MRSSWLAGVDFLSKKGENHANDKERTKRARAQPAGSCAKARW